MADATATNERTGRIGPTVDPGALLAATIEHTGEFHTLLSADLDTLWVSESVRTVLDLTPSAYLNVAASMHIHPDDLERWHRAMGELLKERGGRRRVQYRTHHADGTWRWVECVSSNLLHKPDVAGVVSTHRDVTTRVLAKRRLSQSERRLRSIVSSAADIIAILDDEGSIEYITPTVATILERSTSSMQDGWMAFVHDDDHETIERLFSAALADPGVTKGPADLRLLRGDGEWVLMEALFTDYRSDPIVRGIVCNARDVTARRRAEAEKQANQTIFNALVEMAPIGIFLADADNTWSYVNARIANELGVGPEKLLGTGWMSVFDAADVVRLRSEIARWDGERPLVTELRTRTSPDARELRLTMSRPQDGLDTHGLVGTLEDVTDRRAVDDMLVEGAALGSVAGVVGSAAHDLHNLLASIGMQLGLLDREAEGSARVHAAEEAVDRACNIAEDLMAMSRPSRGRVQPLDVGPIVADLTNMLRVLVDHQADLVFDDWSDGTLVAADRSGLERIVTNLVVNARDAVEPRGRIRIEVAPIELDEHERPEKSRGATYVAIKVIDDGCGIPDALAERVFEPDFTTKEDGNGIGLAASRRNVRAWNGDLRFTSTEGRGTTFTVLLPALG
ncbi:MAG: PAS domain S-box protein [Acidimicrobiales bacterium]